EGDVGLASGVPRAARSVRANSAAAGALERRLRRLAGWLARRRHLRPAPAGGVARERQRRPPLDPLLVLSPSAVSLAPIDLPAAGSAAGRLASLRCRDHSCSGWRPLEP